MLWRHVAWNERKLAQWRDIATSSAPGRKKKSKASGSVAAGVVSVTGVAGAGGAAVGRWAAFLYGKAGGGAGGGGSGVGSGVGSGGGRAVGSAPTASVTGAVASSVDPFRWHYVPPMFLYIAEGGHAPSAPPAAIPAAPAATPPINQNWRAAGHEHFLRASSLAAWLRRQRVTRAWQVRRPDLVGRAPLEL